jgi:hypothetical protein
MKLTKQDNILYLIIILILFVAVILKVLCMYVFKCEEPEVINI